MRVRIIEKTIKNKTTYTPQYQVILIPGLWRVWRNFKERIDNRKVVKVFDDYEMMHYYLKSKLNMITTKIYDYNGEQFQN